MSGMRTDDVLVPDGRLLGVRPWEERRTEGWLAFKNWLARETELFKEPSSIMCTGVMEDREVCLQIEISSSGGTARLSIAPESVTPDQVERLMKRREWSERHAPSERGAETKGKTVVEYRASRSTALGTGLLADVVDIFQHVFKVPHADGITLKMTFRLNGRVRASQFVQSTLPIVGGRLSSITEDEVNTAVFARGQDDLGRIVYRHLCRILGRAPKVDKANSWEFSVSSRTVHARVSPTYPRVILIVPAVPKPFGLKEFPKRHVELVVKTAYLRLLEHENSLSAMIDIPAYPFVPRHLDDAIDNLHTFFNRLAGEYSMSTEGRTRYRAIFSEVEKAATEPTSSEDDLLPPALQALIHLDDDGTGTLDPHHVAHVCGHDRDAILAYLRIVQEQEIDWRSGADEATADGDEEEAAAQNHEADGWANTYRHLRSALEVTVLPGGKGPCVHCEVPMAAAVSRS
ncbi:T3SS (YopN, CesT) and YbjN peptide-binding chaperone 1 [Rhodococcus sp. CH91]|uniref:T3SS (YopN, CesT) and YbjN peptide-binding chaperone 1 n=1 Tax=Rhodococcus sp. CH91 TaxID=2910256 RepID=UPI001F4BCD5D|nr:hypothetical protein [Rhodococcus sp. CH91]